MEKSLIVLTELITRVRSPKSKRLVDLLADFSPGYARNWHFCVPVFFYDALDIQFTERVINKQKMKLWTQESAFNFSLGDVFYNHPYPYCPQFPGPRLLFADKLRLQITATQATLPQLTLPGKNLHRPRNPGSVHFKIHLNADGRWRLQGQNSLSQDDFLKLLIKGF